MILFWETFWFGIEYISLVVAIILAYEHLKRMLAVYDAHDVKILSTFKHLPGFYRQEWTLLPIGVMFFLDIPIVELIFCIYGIVLLVFFFKSQKLRVAINSFKHDQAIIRLMIGMLIVMIVGGTFLIKWELLPTLTALILGMILLMPITLLITHTILMPLNWILHRFHID